MMTLALEPLATSLGRSFAQSAGQTSSVEHRWIARLMRKEGGGIIAMLWRMLGNEADVMDVYQDTFCKLAGLGTGSTPRNPRAYAYRTAANLAIELIRSRKRRRTHLPGIAAIQRGLDRDHQAQPLPNVELEQLRDAISRLPDHLRNVVVLRDLGGLSYRDLAKSLGISAGTARVYRRHAVVRLAQILGTAEE